MISVKKQICLPFFLSLILIFSACVTNVSPIELTNLKYDGKSYVEINGNIPQFTEDEIKYESFESYSELDSIGRCGAAIACIGQDIMPTEEREPIGQIKPSGWQLVKYDIVDGKYLYNRCHLIGYQLTGENANERNLITGTRSMNVDGMLPFENMVDDYIEETNNHVMYRVTPIFKGNDLVARGIQMEGYSVEDEGRGVSFNVFVFNAQPGISINYADGTSSLGETIGTEGKGISTGEYILNTNSKKIHLKNCSSVKDIKPKNKQDYTGEKGKLIDNGYSSCGICNP